MNWEFLVVLCETVKVMFGWWSSIFFFFKAKRFKHMPVKCMSRIHCFCTSALIFNWSIGFELCLQVIFQTTSCASFLFSQEETPLFSLKEQTVRFFSCCKKKIGYIGSKWGWAQYRNNYDTQIEAGFGY